MTIKLKPLAEQVMVITGASSGIGLVTARAAAAKGAKVLLVARSEDALREAADGIRAAGGTAEYKAADVGDAGEVKAAAAFAVQTFGRIDSWVSDAGVAIYAKLLETPADEHHQLFRTNYFGTVHSAEAAVPELAKAGGALIVVASIASDIPSPVMGAYSASKHAVKAYVQSLRIELHAMAPNVSVTLIKPSGIDTPIGQHAAVHGPGEGQIPPPIYAPELVAEAILAAAVRPQREITVGGLGRAQVLFAEHFPAIFERIAPLMGAAVIDPKKEQPKPSNLFEGVRAGEERSGEHHAKPFSVYTSAAIHRKTTIAGVAGLALAAGLLFRGRKK